MKRFYYGWVCMVVAALAMVGTLPGRTQGLGLITAPMLADLSLDPLRFSEANSRGRHKYAFVPYGGGAHMCLGLHFAYMQAKCFAYHLFTTAEVTVAPDYRPEWKLWPIPQPRDGLQVHLSPLT